MKNQVNHLPSRKWSIVALGSAGLATVIFSWALLIAIALLCFALPVVLFLAISANLSRFGFVSLLLAAFGAVSGYTILASLLPKKQKFEAPGVAIDLAKETQLAGEIRWLAEALHEPMPSDVYLLGDVNAFVTEVAGEGTGKRRILAFGLPLMRALSLDQFRAVLAHEFAHYYAGDTQLGPWVYGARLRMARVYENLGSNSQSLRFLRRWAVVSVAYQLLMAGLRLYWKIFMRITQAISRRQELRSDELACYLAGSRALSEGLESTQRWGVALNSYWNGVVVPVAASGFQPPLADGFFRYMQAPAIAKATSEYLAENRSATSPMDSHPPLDRRMEQARQLNLPVPERDGAEALDRPAIALLRDLETLEAALVKKCLPAVANTDLKPLDWDETGIQVYMPRWRKKVEGCAGLLAAKTLRDLPVLVRDWLLIVDKNANTPYYRAQGGSNMPIDVLFCALALCFIDHGWSLSCQPGDLFLEREGAKIYPGEVFDQMRSGKTRPEEWAARCEAEGWADWPLFAEVRQPVSA